MTYTDVWLGMDGWVDGDDDDVQSSPALTKIVTSSYIISFVCMALCRFDI